VKISNEKIYGIPRDARDRDGLSRNRKARDQKLLGQAGAVRYGIGNQTEFKRLPDLLTLRVSLVLMYWPIGPDDHFRGLASVVQSVVADLRSSNFLGPTFGRPVFRGRASVVHFLGADLRPSNFWGPTFGRPFLGDGLRPSKCWVRHSVVQFLGDDVRSSNF